MMRADDTQFILAELDARFGELVRYLYPEAVEIKGVLYPAYRGPKDKGSFSAKLTGPHAGTWYRFSAGLGGNALALIAYSLTGTTTVTRETFDEARRFLGIAVAPVDEAVRWRREEDAIRRAAEAEAARRAREAEQEADEAERQERALDLWEQAGPIQGTPGALYLASRGLVLGTYSAEMRYLDRCRHISGGWSGAIIARVLDQTGEFAGVWRIYVTSDGQKAFGKDSKLGLGVTAGGAVRLFPPQQGAIGIAEGVETALAIYVLTRGAVSPWAGLSTSGIAGFEPPFEVSSIRIYPDGDLSRKDEKNAKWQSPPGLRAAEKLKARMDAEQTACVIQPPPPGKRDFLDVLTGMQARGLL